MERKNRITGRLLVVGFLATTVISAGCMGLGALNAYANYSVEEESNEDTDTNYRVDEVGIENADQEGDVGTEANYSVDEEGTQATDPESAANSGKAAEAEKVLDEEKPDGTPFSVPGNAELLDDVTDDDSKQFITVRTKNDQTFFVVIDRQNSAENVYMLSMIDEDDLSEFLSDEEENDGKLINIPEKKKDEQTDNKELANEKIEKKSDGSTGGLLVAIGIIILIVGGYYFLKIRPKRQNSGSNGSGDDWRDNEELEEEEHEDYDDLEEGDNANDDSEEGENADNGPEPGDEMDHDSDEGNDAE